MIKETTRGAATGIGIGFGCCAAPFILAGMALVAGAVFFVWALTTGGKIAAEEEAKAAKARPARSAVARPAPAPPRVPAH